MKTFVLLIALLALIPSSVAAGSDTSTVSVAIVPGSFIATLTVDDGSAILTVDDATGTGRGWWVTVRCGCDWAPVGEIRTLAGDGERRPHWQGTTLIANPDEGMGIYRQAISIQGTWVVTSGQGERP